MGEVRRRGRALGASDGPRGRRKRASYADQGGLSAAFGRQSCIWLAGNITVIGWWMEL